VKHTLCHRHRLAETFIKLNEWHFTLNVTGFNSDDVGHYVCIASNSADKVIEVFDAHLALDGDGKEFDNVSIEKRYIPISATIDQSSMEVVKITGEMILIIVVLIGSIIIVFIVCVIVLCYHKSNDDVDTTDTKPPINQYMTNNVNGYHHLTYEVYNYS
jgi:hypothetical protein